MTELYLPLILLFVCSALTSYVATAIVRRGASHVGLVDEPGDRKIHTIATPRLGGLAIRSEEHTSELQSQSNLVCRLLLEKKKKKKKIRNRSRKKSKKQQKSYER